MPMHIRRGYEKSFNDFMIARLITLMAELLLIFELRFRYFTAEKNYTNGEKSISTNLRKQPHSLLQDISF